LILITDQSNPPVAKIADANKYQYEVKKRTKEQQKKARQAAVEIKEIKLRPQIGDHDLGIKMNQTQKFINKNAKVKITIQLRGREIERGRDVLTTILSEIEDRLVNFKFDQPLQQAGNRIVGVIIKDG
jgi:translation initiation factor IF-3